MLPSELLIARRRGGTIHPVFSPLTPERLQIAEQLIDAFESWVGKRRGGLMSALEAYEKGYDHRFIRGLVTLLERRCTFETRSVIDPILARRMVFERANVVIDEARRREVLREVAVSLHISVDDLEESLWADYEDKIVLMSFTPPEPMELLRSYNLSVTQTLLFKAMGMDFSIREGFQEIFRQIRYFGLIYSVEKSGETYRVHLDGPLSLFKFTERYGTSLAKLLPAILSTDYWEINADIVRHGDGTRILKFHLDSRDGDKFPRYAEREKFDSAVEAKFFAAFNSVRTGWTLKREPEPIVVGPYVFIPDFGFKKDGMSCYMEIVGFWTREYLKRKIAKLKRVRQRMIVAVDESLACSGIGGLGQSKDLLFYKKEVPIRPVLQVLRGIEERHTEEEMERLPPEIKSTGDIERIGAIAERYGVSVNTIKRRPPEGYKVIGGLMMSDGFLEKLKGIVEICGSDRYPDVASRIEAEGIPGPSVILVLEAIGYTLRWHGLDIEEARIVKADPRKVDR